MRRRYLLYICIVLLSIIFGITYVSIKSIREYLSFKTFQGPWECRTLNLADIKITDTIHLATTDHNSVLINHIYLNSTDKAWDKFKKDIISFSLKPFYIKIHSYRALLSPSNFIQFLKGFINSVVWIYLNSNPSILNFYKLQKDISKRNVIFA